jgi:hypothetical protein
VHQLQHPVPRLRRQRRLDLLPLPPGRLPQLPLLDAHSALVLITRATNAIRYTHFAA